MLLYTMRNIRSNICFTALGLVLLIIYSTVTIYQAHPVSAQQEDGPTTTETDHQATGDSQIFLPTVFGGSRSIVQQIAANLPTDCKNCLTRETFLALPPEELAQIEENERQIVAMAKQQEAQNAYIRSLIQEGKIDTTGMLSDEEIASMSPEAISPAALQQIADQQNAIWQRALANADVQAAGPSQAMDSLLRIVSVPYFRLPEENQFINACGPNAIKITLGVQMPLQSIPWIAKIGQAVDTDGNWQDGLEGGDIPRMRDFLADTLTNYNPSISHNFAVGSSNYDYDTIWEAVDFRQKVINSVDYGHAMIFGLRTFLNFPDWQVVAPHIVTSYGYKWNAQRTQSWIYWADGNNRLSGHKTSIGGLGAYYNSMTTKTLWENYAQHNDFQIYQQ